jgi:ABC-type antimicrobial peptide transport system permease subunit
VVRTANNPAGIIPDVRRVMLELDAAQPPHSIVAMGELLADSIAKEKFALLLLEALAAIALLLAAMGIYSALSYDVARGAREIGVRIALGAQSKTVLRLIVGNGLRLAMLGIAAGWLAALGMTRLMENLLFGVTATDPSTFVLSPILLLFVALLACLAPACRATRIDPLVALKSE